jgi:uridine phosphorylase
MTPTRTHVHSNFGGKVRSENITPYILMLTSAAHVEQVTGYWDYSHRIGRHYGFFIYSGAYKGLPISACSTGLGGMSVSIALEELARLGGQTFLHLGLAEPLEEKPPWPGLLIMRYY